MSMKQAILTSAAVLAIGLSGISLAQTASDQAAAAAAAQEQADAATDTVNQQPAGTAQQYKDMKVDEATAADEKFHANRTQANMLARDKAEAEAAAAAGMAEPAGER
jgi:Flp pilus assembly protein TadG